MSTYIVKKSMLSGEIAIPSSKSHTLRAILFGSLAKGKTVLKNYLPSPDIQAMIIACNLIGAKLDQSYSTIEIEGIGGRIKHAEDVIQAGNSGIVLRFIAGVAALCNRPVVITGDHSIRHQRPMQPLLSGLSQLGASAISTRGDGYAPVIIHGPLKSGTAVIQGEDSQPVSALLIAASLASGPIELVVRNPGEKPWIDLTLNWLERLGIFCENHNYERYQISGNQQWEGFDYSVPGDLSSAAFPIAAALITGSDLLLDNVDLSDCQGDKKLIDIFQRMGAKIEADHQTKKLYVRKSSQLQGIHIDINDCIDGITILATVACFAEGETKIINAAVARNKECDRISCIANELRKLGADISEHPDGLTIRRSHLNGANVTSHGDHRMAMSLAVAGFGADGETHVEDAACISKTFPGFVEDFIRLNAKIQVKK